MAPKSPTPHGRGRRNHWRKVWRQHPERMRENLASLIAIKRDVAAQRQTRLMAVVGLMPDGPMASWTLRDELAEAWSSVFNEEMTTRQAWNEVRFGVRRGVFVLRQDGRYAIMRHVRDAEEGMGTVPEDPEQV